MTQKRLRMIGGPNGSGKSTLKAGIDPSLVGVYINPDDIEKKIKENGYLDFSDYGVSCSRESVLAFLNNSPFLKETGFGQNIAQIDFINGQLHFQNTKINSYFASVISDFLRHELLGSCDLFTFETVMSSPDKIEFLEKARKMGYRTYLYYIATDDPRINVLRVASRFANQGHNVPVDKIISRYTRSLDLLMRAIKVTNRTFLFDNSLEELRWIAEITDGKTFEAKFEEIPIWVKKNLKGLFDNL